MKRFMKSTAVLALMAGSLAAPAFADVGVYGTVDKVKVVDIDVVTLKDKDVVTGVSFQGTTTGSAQSTALVNATIDNGNSDGVENSDGDHDIEKSVTITDSVNANAGIVQFNQDAGNISNQGNVISAAIVFGDEDSSTSTVAEAYADQRVTNSRASHTEGFDNIDGLLDGSGETPDLAATIGGSIIGNVGVVQVNQNVGNMNNQHNVLSAAVGDNALVALSDAGLGQELTGNSLVDVNTYKEALITGSVLGNTGIVNVNQATGAMNNQATTISVASLSSAVGLGQ